MAKKLTNAQLGKAIREGLPKTAGHSKVGVWVIPDAPSPWIAEDARGREKAFETPDAMLRWLGAWDG